MPHACNFNDTGNNNIDNKPANAIGTKKG
jgi:hypothetical protein